MLRSLLLLALCLVAVTAQQCPDGVPVVNCFVNPCSTTTCAEGTTCVSNYCGGCNAECVPNTGATEQPPVDETCAAILCPEGSTCVNGQCGPVEGDGSAASCATILCAPNTQCRDGQCVPFTCSADVPCAPGYFCNEGQCLDRCATIRCAAGYTCTAGQCVENNPMCMKSRIRMFNRPCTREEQYCSTSNRCLDDGTCASDADCANPDNSFITILCTGPITCMSGRCGRTCAAEPAPAPTPAPTRPGNGNGGGNGKGNGNGRRP